MALDLWFREDVARILLATYETMRAATAAAQTEPAYQRGFTDAVRAMALAFGVAGPGPGIDLAAAAHVWRGDGQLAPRRQLQVDRD